MVAFAFENSRERNQYMNVYQDTSKRFNGTWNLLLRWKGSVFKLMWHDLIIFVVVYFLMSFLYRFVLFDYPAHREAFEIMCVYAGKFSNVIPISFLTGFYVTQVVNRWWDQFTSLPWPDKIALKLVSFCPGKDPFRKNLRRTVMRYINLSTVLVYRLVSNKVRDRFPDFNSLVEAKLILPHEVQRLVKADMRTPHESTWTPILWAVKLLQRARTEGKVVIEAPIFANLISSFDYIEGCNRKILNYGWVNFPLAYTQVATVSVYSYFMAALFGRQFLIPREKGLDTEMFPNLNISYSSTAPFNFHTPDFYFPIFTMIEFLSYLGWIKVAETLLNPFGDDDEDFKINYIIDRNLQVSYLIVDEAEEEMELELDPFMEAGIQIPTVPAYQSEKAAAKATVVIPKEHEPLSAANSFRSVNKPELQGTPSVGLVERFRDSFKLNQVPTKTTKLNETKLESGEMKTLAAGNTATEELPQVLIQDLDGSASTIGEEEKMNPNYVKDMKEDSV